jgi:hypothetical protein
MKTITLTNEQYQVLQEMLLEQGFKLCEETKTEIDKWKPKGGDWYISHYGMVDTDYPSTHMREFGTEYQTKEQAEKARDIMKTHNRLLAWLAENDDGFIPDWSDSYQGKYYIYLSHNSKEEGYGFSADWVFTDLSKVYMSKENAEKLCTLLNKGVVEL